MPQTKTRKLAQKPARKMEDLVIDEVSGVDHPAHLEEGWVVMKSADQSADPDDDITRDLLDQGFDADDIELLTLDQVREELRSAGMTDEQISAEVMDDSGPNAGSESGSVTKRTPGIRRALRALAAAKRANNRRIAQGKKPILEGKEVSPATYRRKTGMSTKPSEAAQRAGGGGQYFQNREPSRPRARKSLDRSLDSYDDILVEAERLAKAHTVLLDALDDASHLEDASDDVQVAIKSVRGWLEEFEKSESSAPGEDEGEDQEEDAYEEEDEELELTTKSAASDHVFTFVDHNGVEWTSFSKFNPYHAPAGSEKGGQFTSGSGKGGTGKPSASGKPSGRPDGKSGDEDGRPAAHADAWSGDTWPGATRLARKIMNFDSKANKGGYTPDAKGRARERAERNRIKSYVRENWLLGGIKAKDLDSLTDHNFHNAREAIEELQEEAREARRTIKSATTTAPAAHTFHLTTPSTTRVSYAGSNTTTNTTSAVVNTKPLSAKPLVKEARKEIRMPDIDRAELPDEVRAYIESLETAVTKAKEETETLRAADQQPLSAEQEREEMLKSLPEPVRKRFEELETESQSHAEELRKERDRRETAEAVEKARGWNYLPGLRAEEFGETWRNLSSKAPDEATRIAEVFSKANAAIKESALLKEIGRSTPSLESGSAHGQLDALARDRMEKSAGTTYEQAYADVLKSPDGIRLYSDAERERKEARR